MVCVTPGFIKQALAELIGRGNEDREMDWSDVLKLMRMFEKSEKQSKRYREALERVLNNDEMMITNQEIIMEALESEEE